MKQLQPADFARLEPDVHVELLTRPSLSYWQDAWLRLKRNLRALISLYILLALAAFTLLGPWLWPVDPSRQNLEQLSHGPGLPRKALLIPPYEPWAGVRLDEFPAEPENWPDNLAAPAKVHTLGTPNTSHVRLSWEPVEGAAGYSVYRNLRQPRDLNDLGLPLGGTDAGNEVGYEDRLDLSTNTYYYSVLATDGIDEASSYTVLAVTPRQAITAAQALERRLITEAEAKALLGREIRLEFHPLGTDYLGRDLLARLMEGARVSLFIGLVAPLFYVAFGLLYGGFAGYLGGAIDQLMMRFADFVVALPFLLFMILFKIGFGVGPGESGVFPMLIALILLGWPATARLVRGQVLQIRELGYIDAARLLGAPNHYLILRHIIPNTLGVILVTLTFSIPTAIFIEAFLSFIGMGVALPTPSWGSMCNEGVKVMLSHPHELVLPALFISVTVLAFNLLGDGLTEALDSRMRSRE